MLLYLFIKLNFINIFNFNFFKNKNKLNYSLQKYFYFKEFQLLFQDSGIWDYTILYTFDYYLNFFFINTILPISDYSLTEKASWKFFNSFNNIFSQYIHFEEFSVYNVFKLILIILLLFILLLLFFI